MRASLAGSAASEARRASSAPPFIYNLKAGPIIFDLNAGLDIEFNDNINLSDDNRKADVILRPGIELNSFWQITQLNALRFDLGLSYATYLDNSDVNASAVLIAPNSQLSFDIFVGDFKINLHDRFSIQQDPIDNILISDTANYLRFENAAGLSVLWDLNDVQLVLGYDHYTFKSLEGEFDYLDRSEEQFAFSAAFRLNDANTVGIDTGMALVDYDENFNNDGVTYQAGGFWESTISNYLRLRLAAGYQGINFDSGGLNGDTGDSHSPYAVLTLAHRLNPYITETLSAGHETRLGLTTNTVDLTFARYTASWRMNPAITLNFNAFFEDANESGGFLSENAQRYGGGVSFDYQLTQKLLVGVRYQYTLKESDIERRDYYQNRVGLHLNYNF
ncbi:MAG: outer membrane beta-barrel protein [Verrucomicrobiota bacterium]